MDKPYGVRYTTFDKNDRLVTREKWFVSDAARERFLCKMEHQNDLVEVVAYHDPQPSGEGA